jgi:hypothetical protein
LSVDSELVDMSDESTEDYNFCAKNSYLLFYVFRDFRSNLKKLKPDFELQFSDMEIQDKQIDTEVNIDEENSGNSEPKAKADDDDAIIFDAFESSHEVDSDADIINLDSSEEEDDDDDDDNDEKDYVTNLIKNRKIFFIYNENEKSTSGIFSISNILERRLIKNDKQELESNCWKEIPELNNILKLNRFELVKVEYKKIDDFKSQLINYKYLIKEGPHYYVVQRYNDILK